MVRTTQVILIASLLSACASEAPFDPRTANLSRATNIQLCSAYGVRTARATDIKAELTSRKVFSQEEWELVDSRRLTVGLPECGLYAILPKFDDLDRLDGGSLEDKEVTYLCREANVSFCPKTLVQIRGGRVSSIVKAK